MQGQILWLGNLWYFGSLNFIVASHDWQPGLHWQGNIVIKKKQLLFLGFQMLHCSFFFLINVSILFVFLKPFLIFVLSWNVLKIQGKWPSCPNCSSVPFFISPKTNGSCCSHSGWIFLLCEGLWITHCLHASNIIDFSCLLGIIYFGL